MTKKQKKVPYIKATIRRIPRVESVSELGMSMPTDLPRGLPLKELIERYPLPDDTNPTDEESTAEAKQYILEHL